MTALRALIFFCCQALTTPVYVVLMMVSIPLWKAGPRYFSGAWCRLMIRLGSLLLGVRYTVTGWENVPEGPCVVLAKHQSQWETMFFPAFFPPHCFVLKQEILSIPFFGWGMRLLDPIAIDRDQRREAFQQVQTHGLARLKAGLKVIIFPEGTRVPSGFRARYAPGGGLLAAAAGVPVLPMAHNAGEFWKKGILAKHPGTITVRIGPPIPTAGRNGAEVTREVEAWIEAQMEELTGRIAKPYSRKSAATAALTSRPPRRHRLRIGEEDLHYSVARRARRRSIGLLVDHTGLTVAIPPWVSIGSVEQAIRDQWPWVQKKLQHWKERALPEAPQFRDGDALPWLGGTRTLRYATTQLSLLPEEGGVIEVDPERGPVKFLVQDWYRAQALPLLQARVAVFAEKLGVPIPPVRLSNALGRWGSCNERGEIRLNWRLIKASAAEIDYVVAHEVAHLKHLNHSQDFWRTVGEIYPDFEAASAQLDRNDPLYRRF
jgi:1-acyl-sn-glycerol-3-phosphate acyltransferase